MHIGLRHKQRHVSIEVRREGATHRVVVEGVTHIVEAHYLDDTTIALVVDGRSHRIAVARNGRERLVGVGGEAYTFTSETGALAHTVGNLASPEVVAPMPGKVLQVLVQPGEHVDVGDGLVILEAMKMESRLVAEAAGTVSEVRVAAGDMVDGGQVLVVVTYDAAPA